MLTQILVAVALVSVVAVMWRVVHVVALIDLRAFAGNRLRLVGIALHVALAGGGAALFVAFMLGGSPRHASMSGLLLLVSIALLSVIDRRAPR